MCTPSIHSVDNILRSFHFEPTEDEQRPLEATLNLVPVGVRDLNLRAKMTFNFKIELDENTVVEYLTPETVVEEEVVEKPKVIWKHLFQQSISELS